MLRHIKFFITGIFFLAFAICGSGRTPVFTQNKGQWHDDILYKTHMGNAIGYIDKQGFTFAMYEAAFYDKLHDWLRGKSTVQTAQGHAIKLHFKGGDMGRGALTGNDAGTTEHFYLGQDANRWAKDVRSFDKIRITQVYEGIDVEFGTSNNRLKYDFIVAPYADTDAIEIELLGQNKLVIRDGNLIAQTSVGDFIETKPFAYQYNAEGNVEEVACEFHLSGNVVSYIFPEGYDNSRLLIIDPEIAFSTYIGSTTNSFGFTASYDSYGNLYAGAVVFGDSYPTVAGSFQINFGAGVVDCGISKFNSDGTQLLYSTYIGGEGNEAPHSLVVNNHDELYILGTTSSLDFPVSPAAYQPHHAGGYTVEAIGFSYGNGSDIFVTKLSEDGSQMLAGTYIGGAGNDGLGNGGVLEQNYGDQFRGEIVVDDDGNAYVATVTNSGDFPIVNGFSSTIGGSISGIIFKLSSNLSELIWSTFSGGNFSESAVSLQLAPDNSVYFTGATTSTQLPTSPNAYQPEKSDGVDGYIGHISADGSQLLACTYNGTTGKDLNYFVQLDNDGFVYVVGQTNGPYPVSNNVYSNPNSGQFIHKFSADLSSSIWSTRIGSGSGSIDISPSAFLVSNCGQIYLSGWGGAINSAGSTNILPVTSNAFQTTTDGEDFYLMVLQPNASDLLYATFFGGSQSPEHVDGGTSRFDKNGTVYQAVCAGCFGSHDFPTQPGVWSETNGSNQCNLGVFKFNLSTVNAEAALDAPNVICSGSEFSLINNSVGADTFLWNLGDGNTSTAAQPTHSYAQPGTYTITLYAEDSNGCLSADSTQLIVEVELPPEIEVEQPDPICSGDTIELGATGTADNYHWIPAAGLTASNISNPTFIGNTTTQYKVVGTGACGSDTATVTVYVGNPNIEVSDNEMICPGESIQLHAAGGVTYLWSPAGSLNDPTIANPIATPNEETIYEVQITDDMECVTTHFINIGLLPPPPVLKGREKYASCNGSPVFLQVSGADEYVWSPHIGLSNPNISNPVATPNETKEYKVVGSNACGQDEMSVKVFVQEIEVSIDVDSVVCHSNKFVAHATGGESYIWLPAEIFINNRTNPAHGMLEYGSMISVTGYDSLGCSATASKFVNIYPRVGLHAGIDRIINYGDGIWIQPSTDYPITWDSSPYLSCVDCNSPFAKPTETTTFYANITTPYGCDERDSVRVFVRGNLYVPNSFTPDGDGLNDYFKAEGKDIVEFEMKIFNRWGELVFKSDHIDQSWDGSHQSDGYYCQPGIYPYIIIARERYGEYFELKGHVTLLR